MPVYRLVITDVNNLPPEGFVEMLMKQAGNEEWSYWEDKFGQGLMVKCENPPRDAMEYGMVWVEVLEQ